jgi:uncharacterized protein (TIGR03000 family)
LFLALTAGKKRNHQKPLGETSVPTKNPFIILVALLVLLGAVAAADAQLMSKWGHPVFTVGATPYDSVNAGHGNYPGGPGFIPGYGYYPGVTGDRYPWMDGPDTPFDRRKILPPLQPGGPAEPVLPAPPGAASLVVKLPAEAELWIDESRTVQAGSYRTFTTPPLPAGRSLFYTLHVRWRLKDVELSRVETVKVEPSATVTVNFLTTDSWTGRRVK